MGTSGVLGEDPWMSRDEGRLFRKAGRQRESSNGEESFRDEGGIPLQVRSPREMMGGVLRGQGVRQEALRWVLW